MSVTDFYRTLVTPFGVKGEFYGPQGHRGADYPAEAGQPIPMYEDAICINMGYSSIIGHWVVLQLARDGLFAGFAHLQTGTRPDVGAHASAGESVGRAAGWGDDHGSAWSGSHCHTTLSAHWYGIWGGINMDPVPRIARAATANTAGINKTEIEGDEMPKTVHEVYKGPPIDVPDGAIFMLPKTTRGASYDLSKAPAGRGITETGSVTGYFRLHGLPVGEQVQVRLAMYKGGKRSRVMPMVEPTPGSEGGTFLQFHSNYDLTAGEQLRFEMLVFSKGAKGVQLTDIESVKHYWS